MERYENAKRSLYEYPFSLKTSNLKMETYPIRYPDRYYLMPSTRALFKPTNLSSSRSSHECGDVTMATKHVDDSAFSLTAPFLLTVAAPSATNSAATTPGSTENKMQLSTRSNKLSTRKCRPRNTARYMTQPITLIEIQEIEEDATYNNSHSNNNSNNV